MRSFDQGRFLVGVFCIVFLSLALLFTPSARADFDVSVDSKLTDIVFAAGDTTIVIPFKDGVATWISDPAEKVLLGFYTEAALRKLTGKIYTTPIPGVTPNVGNIYLVARNCYVRAEKDAWYAWPIRFSSFGIGLRSADGKIRHNGLALFGDHAWQDMLGKFRIQELELFEDIYVEEKKE